MRDEDGNIWEVDYFVVIAHYGTDKPEFITMYPAKNDKCRFLPQVDLSYLAYEDEAPGVPSGIRLTYEQGGRKPFRDRWGC